MQGILFQKISDTLPPKTPPPLSCQALPLKSANCPSPPFLGNPTLYIAFL